MFSVISLLVLACAVAINAQGPMQCSETKIGNVPTSHGVKLQPVAVEPLIIDFQVNIPPIAECVKGVSGVHVYMCNPGEAPVAYFTDFNTLKVHRPNSQAVASVTVTVYCNV